MMPRKALPGGTKRSGLWQSASDTRDISSLVLSMFGAFRAHPEVCSIFVECSKT